MAGNAVSPQPICAGRRACCQAAARAALATLTATAAVSLAAGVGLTGCAAGPAPAAGAPGEAQEVAAGVYMLQGAVGEAEPANAGRVGNVGFVVGHSGVVVVDSGTSYRQGQAVLEAVRRVTAQPVRLLVLTHTRQEFLFGAAAFRERGIPVQMHSRAAQLMAARCDGCLKTLRRVLGEEEMMGTEVVKPGQTFDDTLTLTLIGRPLRVLYFGHSSGIGDVTVLDENTGTLFAGGLMDQGRIPDVQDADLPGWHRALQGLAQLRSGPRPLRRIVPGHGPCAGPDLPDTTRRYLLQLQAGARRLLSEGAPLSAVPDALELSEFKAWDQYDIIHRRNAALVFLRLEQQQLLQ